MPFTNFNDDVRKYAVHALGAGLFSVFCVILFFQLNDHSIDTDQVLSLFYAGGEGELLYKEVLDRPRPSEFAVAELKEYVHPDWFDDPRVTFETLAQRGETHPPLYYESLRLWAGGVSDISIFWARFLSLFCAILTSLFAGFWSRDLTKNSLFFWPGALFVLSSYHVIEQSGLIRMHTITLFLAAIFTWSSFKLLEKKSLKYSIIHYLSVLLGPFSTFFFPIYAAPFVFYRVYHSPKPHKTLIVYLMTQFLFILWMIFYGFRQLFNLPYGDFSGLAQKAHGLALEGWTVSAYSDLFLYLGPFWDMFYWNPFSAWITYSVVFGLSFYIFKGYKKSFTLFCFLPFVFVVVGEYVLDSIASQWASGRALNFFLFPLLMVFILSLNKLEKRWKFSGFIVAILITSVGFIKNYQSHQSFISDTPQSIDEKAIKEVKSLGLLNEDTVVLMNRSVTQVLRTALHLRNQPDTSAFIFDRFSDFSFLKLDQYRNLVVIFNPEVLEARQEKIAKYFKEKNYQAVRKFEAPSDFLESKDIALIFTYVP